MIEAVARLGQHGHDEDDDSAVLSAANAIDLMMVVVATTIILYIVPGALYRIYLHPLSKYPGPKLYHTTNLVRVHFVLRGGWVHKVTELHERFGPVVRVGPNEISYVTEQAWADIYKSRKRERDGTTTTTTTTNTQEQQLKKFMPRPPGFQHGLMDNPIDDEQALCRKVLVAGMNDRAVRAKESSVLQKNIGLLISKMKTKIKIVTSKTRSAEGVVEDSKLEPEHDMEGEGEAILDLANCLECVAMDIIGDFVSGETFRCLDNLELNPLFDKIVNSLKQLAIGCGYESCRLTKPIIRMGKPGFDTVVEIRRRLERREQQGNDDKSRTKDDILHHVFKDVDTSKGLYRKLAERVAADAITGGFDTIAIAMVGAMYLLVKNPEKLKTLQDEIRSAFESDDRITLANVNSLRYLTAVFSETLRLWPPGPET
ncbi:hypothetical protein RBB50_012792 [Rhinocladiella similis]